MNPRIVVAALSLSASGLIGIALHEGFRDEAYQDSVNVTTIGFGSTEGVKRGDRITVERGLVKLAGDVSKHEAGLRKCVGDVPMHQYEWDAMVSLTFNVGVGAVCSSSIPDKLRAGEYAAACRTMLDFDKVRDCSKPRVLNKKTGKWECPLVPLRGLTIRRQSEYRTCIGQQ
jgi:lysozyme